MQEENDTQKETQESGSQDFPWRKPTTPWVTTIAELDALSDIENVADECRRLGHSEAAWNLEVHGSQLKLPVSEHRCVRQELLTTASISSPFVSAVHTPRGSRFRSLQDGRFWASACDITD
jgi:hypothetical protein